MYCLNFNSIFPSDPEIKALERQRDGQQSDLIRVFFVLKSYKTLKIDFFLLRDEFYIKCSKSLDTRSYLLIMMIFCAQKDRRPENLNLISSSYIHTILKWSCQNTGSAMVLLDTQADRQQSDPISFPFLC